MQIRERLCGDNQFKCSTHGAPYLDVSRQSRGSLYFETHSKRRASGQSNSSKECRNPWVAPIIPSWDAAQFASDHWLRRTGCIPEAFLVRCKSFCRALGAVNFFLSFENCPFLRCLPKSEKSFYVKNIDYFPLHRSVVCLARLRAVLCCGAGHCQSSFLQHRYLTRCQP